ncbi:hypothetical protein Tco_1066826 [Tanacetum coccineum]|uniref:Uncharacterized protein n=1 Tax=Tanacetum coccineum TaxID=301880 RepID=A0ABQ5HCD8_9ASTR
MGDANPIRTLGDYSKPSHKSYRNTIELLEGNNVVPLRSDTIWLVQTVYAQFHGLCSVLRIDAPPAVKSTIKNACSWNLWEIIENLALYVHERWNESKEFRFNGLGYF